MAILRNGLETIELGSTTWRSIHNANILRLYTIEEIDALIRVTSEASNISVDVTNFDNNLSATDDTVQKRLETLDDLVLSGDMEKSVYDTTDNGIVDNAEKVNNLTVETAVPSGRLFTDTIYDDTDVLKDGDIGVEVQPYNINTVVDPNYVHTDNNFTNIYIDQITNNETDIDIITEAVANLASAQGKIINGVVGDILLTETQLDFITDIDTTNSNIFTFDDVNNEITFHRRGSFNFVSSINISSTTNAPVDVTFNLRNVTDESIVSTQTLNLSIDNNDDLTITLNTLIVVEEASTPLTIKIMAVADVSGMSMENFESILISMAVSNGSVIDLSAIEEDLLPNTTLTHSIGSDLKRWNNAYINNIFVDVTNFDNNLSATDDTVQKRLETLDDLVLGGSGGITVDDVKHTINSGLNSLANNTGSNSIAIGENSLNANTSGDSNVAIGVDALKSNTTQPSSTAVGYQSLSRSVSNGHNTALGFRSGYNVTSGYYNTLIGENTGNGISATLGNTALGYNALSISSQNNVTAIGFNSGKRGGRNQTSVGRNSLGFATGSNNVAVGYARGYEITTGICNVAIGTESLKNLNENSYNVAIGEKALYTTTGASNVGIGYKSLYFNQTANSNVAIGYEALYNVSSNGKNVAIGHQALYNNTSRNMLGIGYKALYHNVTAGAQTAIGYFALYNNTTGQNNTAIGNQALLANTTGGSNVGLGYKTLFNNISGNYNVSFGYQAGTLKQDGTDNTDLNNITCLGYNSACSGDNQVQLGDSTTTTYVYGTVQNRSDSRDKTDIRDTLLGLDFINKIRPVDFKWNMREDYREITEETIIDEVTGDEVSKTIVTELENDGSRKRNRYHQGVIAQEVKIARDELGVDFGGFQDHSLNGGTDVKTIGYDEFVAPLIRAVQELSQQNSDLLRRIEVLENTVNVKDKK